MTGYTPPGNDRQSDCQAVLQYQKIISKSFIPFHFPGMFGSNDVLSTQVPYRAGAHGLSIWNGLRPGPNARGSTPSTACRCRSGGGVSIARTGFCGPIGALYSCAEAVVTSAARIAIINVFMFFPFARRRANSCLHHALLTLYSSMDYLEKAGRVLDIEIFELKRLRARLDENFSRAVELIRETVDARGKVVVVGVGKSGHIGAKIAATLTSTGSPAVVLDSSNALHGDLGMIADGDVVLALSASGETEEIVRILPAIARFQVKIIAMCGDPKSVLAQNAHLCLDVNIEQEACPLNLAPTSSTTVMLALGDALAMVLLEARGFDKEDFAKFHPGGMIGRSMLTRVHQIMRPREAMAIVSTDSPIRNVLKAMTGVRAGAAVVTGEDQQLVGIFTHGDFVRHFQSDSRIGERLVADLMTLNPVTVHKDKLAVEVLNLLERHRIDDLVVIDDDNVPVGIVDSQDLTRLKLL